MNSYEIYHPIGGAMNYHCTPAMYEYTKVAEIFASSVEEAFKMSQNDFNEQYALLGIRSTSVGDIIAMTGDDYLGFYGQSDKSIMLVKGTGFQSVSPTWLSYIDWTIHGLFAPEYHDYKSL
jgi:hypothetical protein